MNEVATMLPAGEALAAGDVVTIDPVTEGMLLSRLDSDRAVFGVVAAKAGVVMGAVQPGELTEQSELEDVTRGAVRDRSLQGRCELWSDSTRSELVPHPGAGQAVGVLVPAVAAVGFNPLQLAVGVLAKERQ